VCGASDTSIRIAGIGASYSLISPSLINVSSADCGSYGPTVAVAPDVKPPNAPLENGANSAPNVELALDTLSLVGVPWMSHSLGSVPGGSVSSELLDSVSASVFHSSGSVYEELVRMLDRGASFTARG
jgi:hypothetical protein